MAASQAPRSRQTNHEDRFNPRETGSFPGRVAVEHSAVRGHGRPVALAFGALGIVYGDIGTSPLYAFRESFEHADLEVSQANAYGVASVVFWALWIAISIKSSPS